MSAQQLELWDSATENTQSVEQLAPINHQFGNHYVTFDNDAFHSAIKEATDSIVRCTAYIDAETQDQLYAAVIGAAISNLVTVQLHNMFYQCVSPLSWPQASWTKSGAQYHRTFTHCMKP